MPSKIFVTGANGFIGKVLCRRLKLLGHDVLELTREKQDITKPFTLEGQFDFVFHLAAHNVTHVGNDGPDLYHQVNVNGTRHVLNAVRARHFVLLSTAKVYFAEGKPIDENSPVLPACEYEKSKLAAENLCSRMVDPHRLLVFRAVNIVGTEQSGKAVIPILFNKAKAGEPLEIFGPKDSVLQFLSVDDAVDAFVKVVERNGLAGIYNLASPEKISLGELAVMIKNLCGSRSVIHFKNETKTVFSEILSHKLENELGWKARITIKEILGRYC